MAPVVDVIEAHHAVAVTNHRLAIAGAADHVLAGLISCSHSSPEGGCWGFCGKARRDKTDRKDTLFQHKDRSLCHLQAPANPQTCIGHGATMTTTCLIAKSWRRE
jgi:hypothetical protein